MSRSMATILQKRLRFPLSHGFHLPSSVDLRPWMTTIEDQRDMGSCVANTIAGSLEYLHHRLTGEKIDVSRLFIDFNARMVNLDWSGQQQHHHVINIDSPGDTFNTNRKAALRALQQYGFCEESRWPYTRRLFMHTPSKRAYKEAARRSILPVKVPINVDSVRTCLAHEIPVLVGIRLSSNDADNHQGWVTIPEIPPNEGFHACLVVGYDDRIQHFIIRNSWGPEWGDKGYCYVPYEYLIDRRLVVTVDAFWAIAEIVPRSQRRRGYVSYSRFTQYHQEYMLSTTEKRYRRHHQKDLIRRKKYSFQ